MKWYIYGATLVGLIFVGLLMIEGLAILRLRKADSSERKMWLAVQDKLKFFAAPSGSLIMALLVYASLVFSSWSKGNVLLMYGAVVSFLVVIVISSVWIPRRFKQVGIQIKSVPDSGALDAPLVTLWVIRMLILVGIITTITALL